jgi:hypothetical protein
MIDPVRAVAEMFKAHDVKATVDGDLIRFPGRPEVVQVLIDREQTYPSTFSLVFSVIVTLNNGRQVWESCAGFGADREKAVADGIMSFNAGAFHVLLHHIFDAKCDQCAESATWPLAMGEAKATIGNITFRGQPVLEDREWVDRFFEWIQSLDLTPGTHWFRFFIAFLDHKINVVEVLRDNLTDESGQEHMAAYRWQTTKDFSTSRLFLMVDVKRHPVAVTPTTALQWLTELVEQQSEFTQDAICDELEALGVDAKTSNRAYNILQVTAGREMATQFGVELAPMFYFFHGDGSIAETGEVATHTEFQEAKRLCQNRMSNKGFQHLALMSADMNIINDMFHQNREPKNCKMSPPAIFIGAASDAGYAKVIEFLTEQTRTAKEKKGLWGKMFGK